MLTGPPLLLTQDGIPSFSSCGCDDASKKVQAALWVWSRCDRQQTTAVVREGDLAEKKTSRGWMGCSRTRVLLLTTSVKQTWHGVVTDEKNTYIDIYSFPASTDMFFLMSSLSWDLYFRRRFLLSFLWHFSISAPINFSLLQDSRVLSVPLPVSQTPAQTNIVFNALLLVMNPSVDLADSCWLAICHVKTVCLSVYLTNYLTF